MTDVSTEGCVAEHYSNSKLEQAILDALAASGKSIDSLVPDDLSPVDEFHTGGKQATLDFVATLDVRPGAHILDIGCGIGGPSRYLATARNCRVTGVDLTEDYVRTAEALAKRVGLSSRVSYRQASAIALPFEPNTFGGAIMMHVGMNIADKPALFAEVRRVLKAGGFFAIYDVMRDRDGDIRYPVHWAATPQTSFVASPAEYRRRLEAAGFDVLSERDRGDSARAFFRELAAKSAGGGEPPPLGIHLLMKTDVPQKVANVASNYERRVIAPVEIIARAR